MSLLRVIGRGCYIAAALAAFKWGLAASTSTILGLVASGALLASFPTPAVPCAGE